MFPLITTLSDLHFQTNNSNKPIPTCSLNLIQGFDSQQIESLSHHALSHSHQQQTAVLLRRTNHTAITVEAVQLDAEIVDVLANAIGHKIIRDLLQHVAEAENVASQIPLGRMLQRDGGVLQQFRDLLRSFAQDGHAAGVGVLQVDVGVSVGGEHTIEIEDVITQTVLAEVEVLHTTIAQLCSGFLRVNYMMIIIIIIIA